VKRQEQASQDLPAALEELNFTLVLLRRFHGAKRAQVSSLAGLGVRFL